MKTSASTSVGFVCIFFVLVLGISFFYNRHFPVLVIAGEDSVGTWMSGVLLTFMSAISLLISMRKRWYPWLFFTAFFMLLALDEHFMFHEQLKESIILSFNNARPSRWIYELPVMAGGCFGGVMAILLWRHLPSNGRIFLLCAVALGTASVVIDILAGGVFWEECFKLLAELIVVCVLLLKAS